MKNFGMYLLVMALTTYLIRLIPLVLVKGKIKNRFVLSLLHYMPYAVLSCMSIPAVFYVSGHMLSAVAGFVCAFILAYQNRSLTTVAFAAVIAVLMAELLYLI